MSTRNYTVWFELYGKKLKADITAVDVNAAKKAIQDKIIFHKVAPKDGDTFNECMEVLDDITDILDKTDKVRKLRDDLKEALK